MLLRCDNCGAPLDVAGTSARTRCHYCGQTTRIERLEKVADATPAGWVPPPQWTPPEHSKLAGQSLVYRPVRAIGRVIALGIRLGILAVVGTGIWRITSAVNRATGNSNAATADLESAVNRALGNVAQQINAAGAAENGAIVCSGNDTLTVNARTVRIEGATGVAV